MLAVAQPSHGAEFFVAPAGDDTNPVTREKPFAGLRRAQDAAAPSDTVFLRGGSYVI